MWRKIRCSYTKITLATPARNLKILNTMNGDEEQHRQARNYPWWRNGAIAAGLIIFVNVASLAFYNGNRWYQSWRPSGNDLYVNSTLDKLLFSRPDLAVVSVKCLLQHVLTNTTTPFANPIVAPPNYKQEVEELVEVINEIHKNQPLYSVPDLWSLLTCKALSRLGGPLVTPYRGRENIGAAKVVYKDSLIKEDSRDILNMKRVLIKQGFSLDQLVAIIGCLRTVGFHDSANFHTREEIKPVIRNPSQIGPKGGDFVLPDTTEKCTLDPYVFGSDYFDLLLDYNWKKPLFSKKEAYYCKENDKKRDVLLLDPFSAKKAESIEELEKAKAKAQSDADALQKKKSAVMSGESAESVGKFGRAGEAQFIPGIKMGSFDEDQSGFEEEQVGIPVNPCEHVSMKGIDVMLLDDGLTTGWLHKYSAQEIDFYSAVTEIVLDIQKRGHNINNLYLPKK